MSLVPRARIHLANIAENWRSIQAHQLNGQAGAVVKADAYGHGLKQVSSCLHDAGCDHFFTAHCHEAVTVRTELGPHPEIYILNGPSPDEEMLYREHALTPVINTRGQYDTLCAWLTEGRKLPRGFVLHFDTGMHRLGIDPGDAQTLAEATRPYPPRLIMSHFACADTPSDELNIRQTELFAKIATYFPNTPCSLSNSAGLSLDSAHDYALSRPGIVLYGGGKPPAGMTLKPGLTLEAPILQTRRLGSGQTVGYGATWQAETETTIATIALGYGDGFPRSASNSGYAVLDGQLCPIIGRVSMDLITIQIGKSNTLARPGVYVQLIGTDAPLEDQAARANTLGYELVTGLTARVRRIYDTSN